MSTYTDLEKRVYDWAEEKGIFQKGNPLAQIEKTYEEVDETYLALKAQSNGRTHYRNRENDLNNTDAEILDGFGDILVTVLIGCRMQSINPLEALESALNVIEKRTGKMIDGVFVKDN